MINQTLDKEIVQTFISTCRGESDILVGIKIETGQCTVKAIHKFLNPLPVGPNLLWKKLWPTYTASEIRMFLGECCKGVT